MSIRFPPLPEKSAGTFCLADDMAREMMIYKRLAAIFGALVLMAMIALILDLANPSIGWFRAPINAMLPLIFP